MGTQVGKNVPEIMGSDGERVNSTLSEHAQGLRQWIGEDGAASQAQRGQNYNLNWTPAVFCGIQSTQTLYILGEKNKYILGITSVGDLNGKEIGASVNRETRVLQPN